MTGHRQSQRGTAVPGVAPLQGGLAEDPGAAAVPGLAALARGRPVLLADHAADRGYFICAADRASTEFVVTASTYGRGVLKVAMGADRLAELEIETLGPRTPEVYAPVDLRGSERPNSHADRVATLRALADPETRAGDLVIPGHVFPVTPGASDGPADACVAHAVIVAAGLAGRAPVAAYGEAVDERGFPADAAATARLARRLNLDLVALQELLLHADRLQPNVTRVVDAAIPTPSGPLTAIGYVGARSGVEYVAFVAAPLGEGMRVHVHRRCQVSDVFGGVACGCGEQLRHALAEIQHAGNGVVVYHGDSPEGSCARGRGVTPSAGWATSVEVGSILRDLGANRIFLSSNEPLLRHELEGLGLRVTDHERDDWLHLAPSLHAAGL